MVELSRPCRSSAVALIFLLLAPSLGCDDGAASDADADADSDLDGDAGVDGEVSGDADDPGDADDGGHLPGSVGAACDGDEDCASSLCITAALVPEALGGYCTSLCDLGDPESCGEEGICIDLGMGIPTCLRRCAAESDCREDHDCVGVCLPGLLVADPEPTDRIEPDDEVLSAAVAAVDEERLRGHVARLSGAEPWDGPDGLVTIASRSVFHPDHALAIDYVVAQLSALGLDVTTPGFDWEVANGGEPLVGRGTNIEARLEGADPELEPVLVTAHYDSTASDTGGWVAETDLAPGASDNGSGLSLVLELAEVFSALHETWPAPRDFVFLLFDAEELGLNGAREYVDQLDPDAPLLCALNVDMVGWDNEYWPGRFWYAYRPEDATLASFDREAIERFAPEAEPIYSDAASSALFNGSDHLPFWQAGRCASFLSDWAVEGRYHTVDDVIEGYDWPLYLGVVRSAAAVVAARAYRWE